MRGRMKPNTKQWLNRVYSHVGTEQFLVCDLDKNLNNPGAIQDAHIRGFTSDVGRGRGNRVLWAIVPEKVKLWHEMEVPA